MHTRNPLGRGLSALLPGAGESIGPREIPVEKIDFDPDQPRQHFDAAALSNLAESVRDHGVLQPIIVRRNGDRFALLAGERRVRAARLVGLESIPAVLREEAGLSAFEIALVENLQREDLDAIEEALAYARLQEEGRRTQADVARLVGRSRAHVTNTLRLLRLPQGVLDAIRAGEISPGHARALLALPADGDVMAFLAELLEEGWSVREAERQAKALSKKRKARPRRSTMAPYYDEVAQGLSTHLGAPVAIKARGNRGVIEVRFDDLASFRRVAQSLGLREAQSLDLRESQEGEEEGEPARGEAEPQAPASA